MLDLYVGYGHIWYTCYVRRSQWWPNVSVFFASTGEVSQMNPWCNKTSNIRVTYYCGRVFELHVIVNNIQILRVAQKCFYGEFIPPATIKRSRIFMCKAWYFYPILTKFGVSRPIFVKFLNIIFNGIVQWGPRWYMRRNGRTDRQTGGHYEVSRPFSRLYERA